LYPESLAGKEIKLPLLRKEDNIQTNLKEIGCEDAGWIHISQDRVHRKALVNVVPYLPEP
jgi:hypothetical protein